uniref:Reflectin-like protein A2 n=1 Tax=Doryteuthis opalescens TaxID=1051066 RepID=A0A088MI16_DOROP|nr:reflectin-like protein A2 [Doryteuthis opalescens]
MNRYMMRHRPMYSNMYRTGRKYRGVMEPMSRMTMDFQGRYMDSQGRMVDPRYYEYGRCHDYDRYNGRSMFNNGPYMDGQRYGGWMDFPERYMDMSGYQMDMHGRWMDSQGRYCNPMGHSWSNRQGYYPGSNYGRNMFNPERYMDMSGYQMDMQGRWMDMGGRHVNPFSHSMYGRNMFNPSYFSNRHMDNPERYMDMSGYQMDMQGRWMDTQGRYMDPSMSNMYDNYNYWY